MTLKKESHTEIALRKWATRRGWVTYKLGGLGAKGKPDRVFFGPCGVTVLMEFKREKGGRIEKLQEWHKRELDKVDHTVHFVKSIQEGIAILHEAGEPYGTTKK